MNQYACAITGHRPTRFCFGYNEEDPLCQKLKECLLEQFRILHDEKFVRTFFVGGALGVDMWAGEQLLTLRAQTGYEDIKIVVVVPFIGYDSKWPDQSRHRLKKLIQNANDSIVISHSADVSSYKKRNYYMVDHAEYLIGVFDNQKKLRSGTAQTVNYALHQGKVITLIHPMLHVRLCILLHCARLRFCRLLHGYRRFFSPLCRVCRKRLEGASES